MKRILMILMAALPLSLGTAVAHADTIGGIGGLGGLGGWLTPHALVSGTVVSVDPTAGTFVADASVVSLPGLIGGTGGSASEQVTI